MQRQCYFAILLLSPLGKGRDPSFEQTEIHLLHKDTLCQVQLTGPVVLKKEMKVL